ncbi:MAG: GNAT family N-acetyltransferase [Niabella sp.]
MTIKIDDHLELQLISIQHAAALFKAIEGNREQLSVFLPWVPAMQSVEEVRSYIQSCEALHAKSLDYGFVVLYDGVLIGRIGLHHLNTANKSAAIGYWLSAAYQGKGIISACVQAIIQYGFETLRLNRIEIKAAVHNIKSRAIPERSDFVFEGILREAELVNGVYFDLALYSLLRREYRAAY